MSLLFSRALATLSHQSNSALLQTAVTSPVCLISGKRHFQSIYDETKEVKARFKQPQKADQRLIFNLYGMGYLFRHDNCPFLDRTLAICQKLGVFRNGCRTFSRSCLHQKAESNLPDHRKKLKPPPRKDEADFVAKLKETRIKLNVSQKELGDVLGVSQSTVTNFESHSNMSKNTWTKWRKVFDGWLQNPTASMKTREVAAKTKCTATTRIHRVFLEAQFRENPLPSWQKQTEIAEDIGLSLKQIKQWFKHRRVEETWVSKKLTDPHYHPDDSVKEAVEFVKKFKETREMFGHSWLDVVSACNWPYDRPKLWRFENLQENESNLVKQHLILSGYMSNLPEPKISKTSGILIKKHRDYLKNIHDTEGDCLTTEKIEKIATKTGISVLSLQIWFSRQKSKPSSKFALQKD